MRDLPWYIEEKWSDDSQRVKPNSIRSIKKMVPIDRLLRHYGAEVPTDRGAKLDDWLSLACPFHEDGKASASVNLALGRFRCHACDVGGDVLDVVGDVEEIRQVRERIRWIEDNLL